LVLMRRLDLKLADFDETRLIQYLDHADALSEHFDDGDLPELPALGGMANVTCLIPAAEGGDEKVSIDATPKLIEPALVVGDRTNQAVAHAVTDSEWLSHNATAYPRPTEVRMAIIARCFPTSRAPFSYACGLCRGGKSHASRIIRARVDAGLLRSAGRRRPFCGANGSEAARGRRRTRQGPDRDRSAGLCGCTAAAGFRRGEAPRGATAVNDRRRLRP